MQIRRFLAAAVLAAAALSVTVAPAVAAAPVPAVHHLPKWFRWGGTSDRSHHEPCIVVWGGRGRTKARVCKDGTAIVRHRR